MKDPGSRKALVWGWFLLSVFIPLGLTLEALHALRVPVYFQSAMRREMWTLAHAHGNLLGLLCLVFAALAERALPEERVRSSVSLWLRLGAVAMPLGFFLGGVLNQEGDPSLGILLVPVGGSMLLFALARAGLAALRERG